MAGPESQPGDAEVVRRVVAGDINAYEILVERHRRRVFVLVAKRVPPGDVESVAQGVFVDAYRGLRSFSGDKPFEHWLVRIAMRRCCDYWRERGRSRGWAPGGLDGEHHDYLEHLAAAASREEFERQAARCELREVIDWALGQIGPDDRALIDMVYLEGWPVKEAAEVLGWSVSKAKVRAFRARRVLRGILGDELEG